MPYKRVYPVIQNSVRELCREPYRGHKKGCPNWDKKQGCPPQSIMVYRLLNLNKPVFAIYNKFDLGQHVRRMRLKHPEWTYYQCVCCLYWQHRARKQLREEIKKFLLLKHRGLNIIDCPEACGVDLTGTMKQIGIRLEWPPVHYAYQIALAGEKK